jgi:hypothetical protein
MGTLDREMMYMRKLMTFWMILSFMKMVSGSDVQDVLLIVQLKPGGGRSKQAQGIWDVAWHLQPQAKTAKPTKHTGTASCTAPCYQRWASQPSHDSSGSPPEHVHRPIRIKGLALNFVAADETIATGGCDARSATPLVCCTLIALYDCATASLHRSVCYS